MQGYTTLHWTTNDSKEQVFEYIHLVFGVKVTNYLDCQRLQTELYEEHRKENRARKNPYYNYP